MAARCAFDSKLMPIDRNDLERHLAWGHDLADYTWWEYDAQGIELAKVCDECVEVSLARFRPEILTGYDQSDVDEPIWPDEG